jgi:hypothetical protein
MIDTSIYTTEKSYNYTYWITNFKEQKHYIGVRSCNIPPIHDIGIKYFSSSKDKDFKKNQIDNPQDYDYKIIGLFRTRIEASLNEIELHETYNVGKNPRFYNRSKQTSTGFDMSGVKDTEEIRNKKSASRLGKKKKPFTEEHKNNLSASRLGKKRKPFTEEHKNNLSDSHKNPSEEIKNKMSASRLGKKRGTYKKKLKNLL